MPTPDDTRLLLDVMLGTLTTYLRMCGYDAAYALDRDIEADDALIELTIEEDRTLLTRDVELANRVEPSITIESRNLTDQLRELDAAGFELSLDQPRRCSICNGRLELFDPDEPTPSFAPPPSERTVWRCRRCGQPFWKGSHWDDVRDRLDRIS